MGGSFIVVANQSGLPKPPMEAEGVSTAWEIGLKCTPGLDALKCLRQVLADKLAANPVWFGIRPSVDGVIFPVDPVQLPTIAKDEQVDVVIGSTSLDTVCGPPWDMNGTGTVSSKPVPHDCDTFSGNLSALYGTSASEVASQYKCQGSASAHEVAQLWLRLSRDVSISCPMQWLAEKLLATGPKAKVRMYEFAYNADSTWRGLAGHGAELGYVFNDP